jgi:preprotein translocase subunit SecY
VATSGIGNIGKVPELQKRILFTLLMLAVYRVGCAVPVPGVNAAAIADFFARASRGAGSIFGLLNLFTGGALEQFSVFALGIMPYISASIILQLLTVVIPALEKLSKEGEAGRKRITQYTRYGTVVLSIVQGTILSFTLQGGAFGTDTVINPGWRFQMMTVLTLTSGTAFIMWLGEQITERGIGNGISLIIFAGIVVRIPGAISTTFRLLEQGELRVATLLILLALMLLVIGVIIFFEGAQRRIPIQYAKKIVGRKVYGGRSTYFPLRINTAGVIPPIFASSILLFPITLSRFLPPDLAERVNGWFMPTHLAYNVLYVGLIIFFCYFYTAVMINPVDVADNIKKYGGYIPGIRPGRRTADYIDRVLARVTLIGALYISAVCILPTFLISNLNTPFYFGGTALLIVVGVAKDTMAQIESHLIMRNYSGFLKGARLKGRYDRP